MTQKKDGLELSFGVNNNSQEDENSETASQGARDLSSISPMDIERIFAQNSQSNEALANALLKLSESIRKPGQENQKTKNVIGTRTLSLDEIDEDDVLETPAVFFKHGFISVVGEDFVNGMVIKSPYDRIIVFKHASRQKPAKGDDKAICICSAAIYSRKEAEFLRKHSSFGITLFENIRDAKSVDAVRADALIAAHTAVSRMNAHTVIRESIKRGLEVNSMDTTTLAMKLREKIAIEILEANSKISR